MNWLINKLTGLGSLWEKADGAKTYIAGGASILTGAAGLLAEVAKLIADKNTLAVWAFVKSLPTDQSWLLILGGLTAVGLRHAIQKQDAPVPEAQKPAA